MMEMLREISGLSSRLEVAVAEVPDSTAAMAAAAGVVLGATPASLDMVGSISGKKKKKKKEEEKDRSVWNEVVFLGTDPSREHSRLNRVQNFSWQVCHLDHSEAVAGLTLKKVESWVLIFFFFFLFLFSSLTYSSSYFFRTAQTRKNKQTTSQ